MGYKINPSDDYKQLDGTAITGTSTVVYGGSARNLGSNQTLLDNVAGGITNDIHGSTLIGGNNVGSVQAGSNVTGATVAAVGGYAKYTKNTHGLSVGNIVNVTDANSKVSGPQRITAKDANTFTTTKTYTSGAAATVSYKAGAGNFGTITAEKYVMMRVTDELAGVSNTNLRSGAADWGDRRAIHQLEHVRTVKIATALRGGYYNYVTGAFDAGYPATADDISEFETNGTDDAANPTYAKPGELVYKEPKPAPVQADYPAKTG